jgi:hypothetical protein
MASKKSKNPTIREYIDIAVAKAVQAERLSNRPKDFFKATEHRLFAYNVIKAKIEDDKESLKWHLEGNIAEKGGIVRFQKNGVRLSKEEIIEGVVQDLRAKIAANEFEIERIDKAMGIIAFDPYVNIIICLYFEGKNVAETSEANCCDRSTVFRQKSRLVQRLATFLYGVEAIKNIDNT